MGVPGLINAIGAGERISLSKLAITHLERTERPIRIAVDISIWLFQAQAGKGGLNPELRALFYRLLKFLALPVHPLFIYDGREKPPFKRGKAVLRRSYGSAPIIRLSKTLIDLFRFPRHDAPGEAEAECARLQRAGVVDAVMSNDVDALMFGSSFAVMNFSKESGSGTSAATHVTRYQMQDQEGLSNVGLDRAGMILFAMLSGGDYHPSGVPKCGSKLAAEIAKAGFGQDLLASLEFNESELDTRLGEWRDRLQYELDENESGYFQTKHKAVRIPDTFPDRKILSYYAKPVVSSASDIESLKARLIGAWDNEIDALEIRQFTAQAFDWNYRSGARKVIRLLAEPLVSNRLRLGRRPSAFPQGVSLASSGDASMLQKVYKSRKSFSTDGLLELQLDIIPIDIVGLDLMAEEPNPCTLSAPPTLPETLELGERDDDDAELVADSVLQPPTKKYATRRYDPCSKEKVWIFETIADIGIPDTVGRWRKELTDKATAVKKPNSRKTGTRRKGPIDPGMKYGSILRYGTLTKVKSGTSQPKQISVPKSPASASKPGSSASYLSHEPSTLNEGYPDHYTGGQDIRVGEYLGAAFDEFDGLFGPFYSTSTRHNFKSDPMTVRPQSIADTVVGTGCSSLESMKTPLDHTPQSTPPAIKMSYSNTSFVRKLPTKDAVTPPVKEEQRNIVRTEVYDFDDPPEVKELEESMRSLSLQFPEIFGEFSKHGSHYSRPSAPAACIQKANERPKLQAYAFKGSNTRSSMFDKDSYYPTLSTEMLPDPGKCKTEHYPPMTTKQPEKKGRGRKEGKSKVTEEEIHAKSRGLSSGTSRSGGAVRSDYNAEPISLMSSTNPGKSKITKNAVEDKAKKEEEQPRRVSVVDLTWLD